MFTYRTTVSRITGVTPFKGVFGMDSRVPLDVIFPPPPAATKQWPEYVCDQQQQLHSIHQEMRATRQIDNRRATANQTGKVTRANKVEVGDVVYYFSPRVTRDAERLISKKLALLWTGPYRVVRKPSKSLATIKPLGHWARGDQELTTTVDKLRVIQGAVPGDRLAIRVQINLDELEEDLDDYGEYVRAEGEAEGPQVPEECWGDPTGAGGMHVEPKGEVPQREGGTRRPGKHWGAGSRRRQGEPGRMKRRCLEAEGRKEKKESQDCRRARNWFPV